MDFVSDTLSLRAAARTAADVMIVVVNSGFAGGGDPLSRQITAALKAGDLGADSPLLHLYGQSGVAATRTVLVFAGDGSARKVARAVEAAIRALPAVALHKAHVLLALAGEVTQEAFVAAAQAGATATCVYTATRTAEAKNTPQPEKLTLALTAEAPWRQSAFDHALAVAAGVNRARELGNLPANHATPARLARTAQKMASSARRISCKVLSARDAHKLGMGAFLAVTQGSEQPAQFIVLEYSGAGKKDRPVVLVGKGITFDSGGICIKPAPGMAEMKFDMCGAASVLGVFEALGQLRPQINVVGLMPCCENLPDGCAVKPGDVVTSMDGTTIEILNTDAEGRLVLCDALTYAKKFEPRVIIDIATLTGACAVALGAVHSGMFSNSEDLARDLLAAGEAAQDTCWRLPLDEDYAGALKTPFADVANVGGRDGGAITAAKFLQRFVRDQAWAHLDIAGTAWKRGENRGATGRPVALLLHYLLAQAGKLPAGADADKPGGEKPAASKSRGTPKPSATAGKSTRKTTRRAG